MEQLSTAWSRSRAVCMLAMPALLLAGCAQPPLHAGRASAAADEGPALAKVIEAYRFVLLSGTRDCTAEGPTCTVDVKMSKLTRGPETYCLAEAPAEILFGQTHQGNRPRTILWRLVPKDSSFNLTVEFQPDHGILVLKTHDGQIGNGRRPVPTQYEMRNLHDKTGTSVYLPIILQTVPGQEPRMCAAADPKIVNN